LEFGGGRLGSPFIELYASLEHLLVNTHRTALSFAPPFRREHEQVEGMSDAMTGETKTGFDTGPRTIAALGSNDEQVDVTLRIAGV